jgi:hypothetical protein
VKTSFEASLGTWENDFGHVLASMMVR